MAVSVTYVEIWYIYYKKVVRKNILMRLHKDIFIVSAENKKVYLIENYMLAIGI